MDSTAPSDAELVGRARLGDAEAFASLVDRHERTLLSLAYARTACAATAADVVQDAVVKCWRRLDDLQDPSRVSAWLATCVRRLAADARRRPSGRMKLVGGDELDAASSSSTPGLNSLEDAETSHAIARAIAQLDEVSAACVTLRYYQDLSSIEIGRLLELSPAAVDMRLSRARQQLRKALDPGIVRTGT